MGENIENKVIPNIGAGKSRISLSLKDIPSGMYLYKITVKNNNVIRKIDTHKFILLK